MIKDTLVPLNVMLIVNFPERQLMTNENVTFIRTKSM